MRFFEQLVPAPYRLAFSEREFNWLLSGFLVSSLGDGMSIVTVSWLALTFSSGGGAGPRVGAAVAAYTLPGIAGLLLSRRLGRFRSQSLLLLDCCVRTVGLGLIPLLWALGALSFPLYICLLALSSVMHAWGMGARRALVSDILPREAWLVANSLLVLQAEAMLLAGPILAGFLVAALGPAPVIGLDAASYAFLGVLLRRFKATFRPDAARESEKAASVRLIFRDRLIGWLFSITFVFYLLYGLVEVALPTYVSHDLHGSAASLGLVWGGFGLGSIVGAASTGVLRRVPLWPALAAIVVGWGAAMLPLGISASTVAALLGFGLGGLVYAPYTPLVTTLLQRSVERSRVVTLTALWSSLLLVAPPVGALIGGATVRAVGSMGTFLLSAVATMALGGAMFAGGAMSRSKRLRSGP